MRRFTSRRANISAQVEASLVGDLRFSAKSLSGTGVVEPIPGFLFCNGAVVSRTTYKRLFDLIGTAFNTGGEAGTDFRLPDFRGRFLTGATDGAGGGNRIAALVRGGILGAEAIALAVGNVPPHTHAPGTLNISSSGGHVHGVGTLSKLTSSEISADHAIYGSASGTQKFLGGSLQGATHSHPIDTGNNVGNGSADGLAASAHQNVHPHQAVGGILVAY